MSSSQPQPQPIVHTLFLKVPRKAAIVQQVLTQNHRKETSYRSLYPKDMVSDVLDEHDVPTTRIPKGVRVKILFYTLTDDKVTQTEIVLNNVARTKG